MTHQTNWAPTSSLHLKRGFKIHFTVFLFGIAAMWLIWYVTNTSYPWPLWSTGAWAIGVLFHYLGVFVFKKSKGN